MTTTLINRIHEVLDDDRCSRPARMRKVELLKQVEQLLQLGKSRSKAWRGKVVVTRTICAFEGFIPESNIELLHEDDVCEVSCNFYGAVTAIKNNVGLKPSEFIFISGQNEYNAICTFALLVKSNCFPKKSHTKENIQKWIEIATNNLSNYKENKQ